MAPDEQQLLVQVNAALKVEELALFHFFSKSLSQQDKILLERELRGKSLLCKARRNALPHLKYVHGGILSDNDTKRNDDFYVFGYVAYPLLTNENLQNRIDASLSTKGALQMAFPDLPDTVLLPLDMEMLYSFKFTFLGTEYIVYVDPDAHTLTYRTAQKVLFENTFADETFLDRSHEATKGLHAIMARFIAHLSDGERAQIWDSNGLLLKELFNCMFAFRVQLSFPGELPYTPYSAPDYPQTRLEALCNEPTVRLPSLHACEEIFFRVYQVIPHKVAMHPITEKCLEKMVEYFRAPLKDGVNDHGDTFSYLGGISAQVALHTAPEISGFFVNPLVLVAIMQINKAKLQEKESYERLLLIKRCNGEDITLFSLVRKALTELDPVHLRIPPNRRFDIPRLQAETDYLQQLTTLYENGSPLVASLLAVGACVGAKSPMEDFSQVSHCGETVNKGIERLAIPLTGRASMFSNLHGFKPGDFYDEFTRGINCYLENFEVLHQNIVQAHIVDFVKRVVDGSCFVEPRFKHDLLDPKHFAAGLTSQKLYLFVDGQITFQALVLRCLYEIKRQKSRTINAQLLVDAVYLFLRENPHLPYPLFKPCFAGYPEEHMPYVTECLTILKFHISASNTIDQAIKAVQQRLAGEDPTADTEALFNLLPPRP
jgi:hypothetical protein